MKTGLGLNFLRIVNEEGLDGWSQVYARIPMTEEELGYKGTLFGVIKARGSEPEEKEEEVMMRVDESFNETNGRLDLSRLVEGMESLSYVWVLIYENERGEREMKMIKNKGGVWILRGRERIDLGVKLDDGRVIKGELMRDDRLYLWVGEMQTLLDGYQEEKGQAQIDEMVDELVSGGRTGAALIIKMEEWEGSGVTETKKEITEVQQEEEIKEVIEEEPEKEIVLGTSEVYWQVAETEKKDSPEEVVSDSYVGKIGPRERLVNWWKRIKGGKKDLEITGGHVKRKKWARLVGVVFLILLIVSVGLGTIKVKNDREQKKWVEYSEPIEKKRQEAVGLVGINLVGARKLMGEVKTEFATGKDQFAKTRFRGDLGNLEKKIAETWLLVSGEKPVAMDTKLNIGLVREGFSGVRLNRLKGSNFLVLDNQMGVVVIADGASKEIKVMAGKGQGWQDVVFDGKRNVILDGTGLVGGDGSRLVSFDSVVGKAVALGVFGNNVYVLDQVNKEIYKYVSGESVFGDRVRWLKEGQSMTSEPMDLAMDSDIWVLEKGNMIERFRRGAKENFSLNGVPEGMGFGRLAVESNGDRVAVLDSGKGMVVIFGKTDGNFKEQLKVTTEQKMTDLEFDDTGGLWILAGGVVGKVK